MNTTANQPTHKIFAIEDIGPEKSFFREIGAGWLNDKGALNLKFKFRPITAGIKLYIKDMSAESMHEPQGSMARQATAPKIVKRNRYVA